MNKYEKDKYGTHLFSNTHLKGKIGNVIQCMHLPVLNLQLPCGSQLWMEALFTQSEVIHTVCARR